MRRALHRSSLVSNHPDVPTLPQPLLLAPIVLQRQRMLVPATLALMIFYTVSAAPMGITLPVQVWAFDLVTIAWLTAFTALVILRRIPAYWSHAVSTAVWVGPTAALLVTQYYTHNTSYLQLITMSIATAGVMLNLRHVIAGLILVNALAIPLVLRDVQSYPAFSISVLITSGQFALMVHFLFRASLTNAETHRIAEAETARKLAFQLTELERSQTERDKLKDQLLHAQRMEAVGTLAAGIAHDMNNVLGAITSFADLLRGELTEPRARRDLEQMIVEAERGAKLTRGLLVFSRHGQYRKQVILAASVVRDACALLERTLPKSIAIHEQIEIGDARLEGDSVHIIQALINFGLNAADAMSGSGSLGVSARLQQLAADNALSLEPGRYVKISVSDTGIGMDAATKLRAFEPFFTTKPLGRGTGLGLSAVWGIAQAHHGTVDVESEPGKGATFSIHLPTTDAPLVAREAPAPSQLVSRSGRTLVVDDEPMVRRGTARILEKLGFEVTAADDGAEALRIFAERDGDFDLVVLDMRMPVMEGPECFAELRKRSQVPVLVATGYAVDTEAQALVAAGAGLIEKPFRADDLAREVTRMLGGITAGVELRKP